MEAADLRNRFAFHPASPAKGEDHQVVRDACLAAAEAIDGVAPDCREKSLAVTKLEEAMMHANAAIARHDEHGDRL